jgi:acetyl-CoA C-acetyltransferase
MVADPLRLYDFCPVTDGAAALLFVPAERAEAVGESYVTVAGVAGATDTHVVHEREDPTVMGGVVESGEAAFEAAGWERDDVDVAELHDMFTILECLQLEGLGFADRGEAWRLAMEGVTARDGSFPVNTSGGLKSKGHPLGASGVAQLFELYEQLTGTAGERQVEADRGLACNVGGFGNCVVTTLLEAP